MDKETELRLIILERDVNSLKGKSVRWKVFRALMFLVYIVALVYGAVWFLRRALDRRTNRPIVQEMVRMEVL